MKYTGPSMPTFNLYCDEDLDTVLSVLGEKLEIVYRERGLDLSPLTFPSCFDLTNIQKTNLVSVLNGIMGKVCEIEDKGVIVKTSIDNVRVFLDKLPDTFWSTCITPPNPCDNEITLTTLLQHIISEICDLFSSLGLGSPVRLQWLVADPNYGNIQNAANNYAANLTTLNGHTSAISSLQTKTADVNLVTDSLTTSLNLTTAVTSLDASLLTTLQLVTGGTAISNPTYGITLNATGINKGSATYPTAPSSVKTVLNNLIYDILQLQSAGSSVVTAISTTRTGAYKADITLTQTGGTTTITTSLNNQPYLVRLASNYPSTPHVITNAVGTATGSGVLSKYDAFAFSSGNTLTNAPSSWYTVAGTQTGDRVIIQQNGLYKITTLGLGVIQAPGLAVSTYSLTSNVLTINTATNHNFQAGQTIRVSNLTDADINGEYVLSTASGTTMTMAKTHANIGSTTPGSDAGVRLSHLNMGLHILKTINTGFTNWSASGYSVGRSDKAIYNGAFSNVLTVPYSESFSTILSLNADDVIGMGLSFSQNGSVASASYVKYYYYPTFIDFVGNLTIEQLTTT
jgi:hypothetical protein